MTRFSGNCSRRREGEGSCFPQMSDETPDQPEQTEEEVAPKKKVTRKRVTKKVPRDEGGTEVEAPAAAESHAESAPVQESAEPLVRTTKEESTSESGTKQVVRDARRENRGASTPDESEIPEVVEEQAGVIGEPPSAEDQGGGKKRRRRRRKGPGESEGPGREGGQAAPRPKLDPEKVAKHAWKIYLSEVCEEGLALIGDSDARELSRRSFRMAEIFLEEEARREPRA